MSVIRENARASARAFFVWGEPFRELRLWEEIAPRFPDGDAGVIANVGKGIEDGTEFDPNQAKHRKPHNVGEISASWQVGQWFRLAACA